MHERLFNKWQTHPSCMDLPVHEQLFINRQSPKTQQCVSLHLSVSFCPTRGSSPEPQKRVCTYLCTSVCPTRGSSQRTTQACLDLPVHERLSNKRQFTKNQKPVSVPTCARASVQQEAVHQEPPKRVWTYLCTSVCPSTGNHQKHSNECHCTST